MKIYEKMASRISHRGKRPRLYKVKRMRKGCSDLRICLDKVCDRSIDGMRWGFKQHIRDTIQLRYGFIKSVPDCPRLRYK